MKHLFTSLLLLPVFLFSQAPVTTFESFDCNNLYVSYPTIINSVLASNDTLFMPTSNFGFQDFAVARTTGGNMLWAIRTIPDSLHATKGGSCMLSDGNLIIDYSVTLNGDGQNLVVKINRSGHILWERLYAATGANTMPVIVATDDGGFIMSGGGCIGGYLTQRCDVSGNIVWTKVLSVSAITGSTCSMRLVDGGQHILFDGIFTNGNYNCVRMIKTDLNANVIWMNDFDFGAETRSGGMDEISGGGGYVVSGSTIINGHSEPLLFRIDVNGNLTWSRMTIQGAESYHNNVMVLPDNSLLAVGSTPYIYAQSMTFNCGLIDHYDAFGNLLESYRIPCDTVNFRLANSVIYDLAYSSASGLIYATGEGSNIAILLSLLPTNAHTCGSIPLNPAVTTPSVTVSPFAGSFSPIAYAMANYYFTEETIPVTFYSDCVNTTTNVSESTAPEEWNAFPVPASDEIHLERIDKDYCRKVRLEVYSTEGKLITEKNDADGNTILNCNSWPNGQYSIRLTDENGETKSLQVIVVH